MTPIVLPAAAAPTVTIVIVTYGQWAMCRRALEAVVEHTDPVYEVVVVDNASPDGTAESLRREVVGATVVFNDENHGFGAAANQGALHAVGRHLCFLNSDAFVTSGWLPPMLEVLDNNEGVAAVAPRFLHMDGTLQEAGYVLDHIGVTHAVGEGGDPERVDYRFSRILDYGSGACLLIRRRDFTAVGGFDPVYGRGYYEDVDLGLALASHNRRVMYEPRSKVRHIVCGSGVLDESTVEQVVINRATFRARWSDEIASRPCLESLDRYPHRLTAARDFTSHDRILVLGDRSGRAASLAEGMARQWPTARITLLDGDQSAPVERLSSLLAAGVEVVQGDGDPEPWLEGRRFHYSVVALGCDDHESLAGALARTQPQAMRILDLCPRGPRRLEGAAYVSETGPAAGARAGAAADSEIRAIRAADVVLCVSQQDRLLVSVVAPETPALVLPPVIESAGNALVEAMSYVGVAPPLARLEPRTAGA